MQDQGGYYYASLEGRSLDPGAEVRLEATGGEFPAFDLASRQPAVIDAEIEDELLIEDGSDAVVECTPVDPCLARVRLTLRSTTARHGIPPSSIIECDVVDAGSLTIPQALIEAFPEAANQEICVLIDCPASSLTHYTRAAAAAGDTQAELVVESVRSFAVVHPR